MLYEYCCPKGHHFEAVLAVADYRTPQSCPKCGTEGRRIISVPRLVTATPNVCFDSPIDGRPITSMAQRRDDMARNNCREYDPMMRLDAAKFRKETQEKLERSVDESVERHIDSLPDHKREKLNNELASGADTTVERRQV